jgi:hypothetical protein
VDRALNTKLAGNRCDIGPTVMASGQGGSIASSKSYLQTLESIREARALAERFEEGLWSAELLRLRGVFLTAIGAEETQIEASLCEATKTAKKQKSISLQKRAEATHEEYWGQKASASGGRGFRLPV